jgi:hypothetical protein
MHAVLAELPLIPDHQPDSIFHQHVFDYKSQSAMIMCAPRRHTRTSRCARTHQLLRQEFTNGNTCGKKNVLQPHLLLVQYATRTHLPPPVPQGVPSKAGGCTARAAGSAQAASAARTSRQGRSASTPHPSQPCS